MANLRTNNLSGEQGQNAYRGSVLLESASSSRISVTNTTGLDFGTDQFTIEFWIYLLKEPPVNKNIFARSTSASNTTGMIMWFDGNGHLEFDSIHGVSGAVHTGAAIGNHMWHHIAVTRDSSNNTRLYLNGVNKASASSDTSNIVGATNLQIASNIGADGYYNDAYISNFRMVKGTAIYSGTTDFTPPQSELTVVDGTILLCCQDSNDPTQEATDKTVTGFGNLATAGYLGTQPKVIPPFGVDAGNTFGGSIQQSSQGYMCFPTGRTEERGRGRGVVFGGYNPSSGPAGVDEIYYLSIQSMGNAIRFGDLSTNSYSGSTTCASSTRALKAGGAIGPGSSNPNKTNNIEFVTIATTGNSQDFGDMLDAISFNPGGGNQTRGIWMGGEAPGAPGSGAVNTIQFVTIANLGNAQDFGDLRAGAFASVAAASPTRMLAMGGGNPSSFFAYIDFVEIATTGNASDFGDMSAARNQNTGVSSNTRAIAMGGNSPSGLINSMEFVTIATLGDATDFGDLSSGTEHTGSVNNSTRGVQTGGRFPSYVNTMEFITIASTGNSLDFGDIPKDSLAYVAGASDSHGGLS